MSVTIVLTGVGPDRFTVTVSPFAELAATLHVLTEHTHHSEHASWAAEVASTAPPAFQAGLRRFAPLWTPLRWRAFYPGLDATPTGAALTGLDLDRFAELTAHTCVSRYHGLHVDRVLRDPAQAAALRTAAARLPAPYFRLTEDLLRDPEALRADVLAFVALCREVYFDALWAETAPVLTQAQHLLRRRLSQDGPAAALGSLSPSTLHRDPERVVFDKVHDVVINPARTPVLLVPTRYGAPHLLVKNEPGLPPVVHFPVEMPGVGVTLARNRMLALTDPHRVRLCRFIARQAMTTADLADRLAMTRPMVARHLRVLRELGLVRVARHGRYVHYALDLSAVERIGQDVVTALQR